MFLVHGQLGASRFPYHVRGGAMPPVRRSLKNQRTAQSFPIPDIHRGVGVGVRLPTAALATVGVFLPIIDVPAGVARFAGVGGRNLLKGHARKPRLVADELLQLAERPIVAVLAGIRLGGLALLRRLANAAQIFQPDAGPLPLGQSNNVFAE